MKHATSIIIAVIAFVAFASICDNRFYKTKNMAYQIAIIFAVIFVGLVFDQKNKGDCKMTATRLIIYFLIELAICIILFRKYGHLFIFKKHKDGN